MKIKEGRDRVIISAVIPQIEEGRFSIKRVVGDKLTVSADIFTDSYHLVSADLLYRHESHEDWKQTTMKSIGNDRWEGEFYVDSLGLYFYTIHAWVDYFQTWQRDLQKKFKANLSIRVDLEIGLEIMREAFQHEKHSPLKKWLKLIESAKHPEQAVILATDPNLHLLMRDHYPNKRWITALPKALTVTVDPFQAQFSAWYEMFPRSSGSDPNKHSTIKDCLKLLPYISKMGFDVIYLPPVHAIGLSKRKGKNNRVEASEDDLGSPWAIGYQSYGHKSVDPSLGTSQDIRKFVREAKKYGMAIALDLAFQTSPDHPYLKEHLNWFRWRPDGTIQHAENPPKIYEDIIPFYFETEDWSELWDELKSIVVYWIEQGITIFRVDNPHTKPFAFWEWLIDEIKRLYPEVIFLSEAFTRPKVMYWLSKLGFSQSYTYFAWRHTKQELIDYVTEITSKEMSQYFRPNFWPNTPDILTEELQRGNKSTFMSRLVLAATLSSNYGIYGPAFELMIKEAVPGTEEYLDSEKYESKYWNRNSPESLSNFISQINLIRRENQALQCTKNIKFLNIDNNQIIYYGKFHSNPDNNLLIFVNLDSFNKQTGNFTIPLKELAIDPKTSYQVHELISDQYFIWEGENRKITLDPSEMPICILKIGK